MSPDIFAFVKCEPECKERTNFQVNERRFFFSLQEIDGHSFLLLTAQELHHVLGIHLGPAMKIHDYIFTLQQLVNEAYQNSKAKLQKR